jgi:carboxylate-amine ligase
VEEEYQLIDRDTGALRSMASAVRGMDWTGELVQELHETQVEIGTPVCRSAAEIARELARLRFQAATVSATRDLALVAAGTHPYSLWSGHAQTEDRRYERIAAKYGRIVLDEHIFGMHIHVAVPAGIDRVALINTVRHFLPHLLSLSGSSPYFEGDDTGFASWRSILWR